MGQIPMLFTLPRVVQVEARVIEFCAPKSPPHGEDPLEIMRCAIREEEFVEATLLARLARALGRFPSLRGHELTAKLNAIGGNYTQQLTLHYRQGATAKTFLYRVEFGFEIFNNGIPVGFINLWCLTPDWPQQWPLHHSGTYPLNVPVAAVPLLQAAPPIVH